MPTTPATPATPPRAAPDGGGVLPGGPALDRDQAAAVVGGPAPVRRVLGAPGTGKTTVAVATVVQHVRAGLDPDRALLVGPTRLQAAHLRERLTAALGATSTRPLARTLGSYAFGVLAAHARLTGAPAPRLLTGAEQDAVLRDLLAGHAAGTVPGPRWPESLAEAVPTRGFRGELRDLVMRAVELDLEPHELAAYGQATGRPEWVAAARVLREYDEVTALAFPGAYDPAWVLGSAADVLAEAAEGVGASAGLDLDDLTGGLRLVVVDDAQEVTRSGALLLRRLVDAGAQLVLVGDPDAATGTFRGADPGLLGREAPLLGDGPTSLLRVAHRGTGELRAVLDAVTDRIASSGVVAHRRPGGDNGSAAAGSRPAVEVAVTASAAREAALVAERLREAHLLDGVPWSSMAVVVRGGGALPHLRRVLAARGVPVRAEGARTALRDEPAVRPLLTLLAHALDRSEAPVAAGGGSGVAGAADPEGTAEATDAAADADVVLDVLASPLLGLDSLALRRIRRGLRAAELAAGGSRGGDELLAAATREPALLDAADLGRVGEPLRRLGRMLADARGALRGGADTQDVLWAMWRAAGVADAWRAAALAGGGRGAQADRDLDAVLALFAAAQTYAERLPGRGPRGFLEHVASLDVAADTLARGDAARESVTLSTVSGVAGQEYDLVCVCGVQDGAWPDVRVRGSVLGSAALVEVATGRDGDEAGARAALRSDETRLFLAACSRARRRLLVTAVSNEDEVPSVFLDVVAPAPEGGRRTVDVGEPLSLAGVVAALRRRVALDDDPAARAHAADRLARLAEAGVRGADPDGWWALRDVSDHRPVAPADAPVSVSPSQVEAFDRCGLRWLLTRSGGENAHRGDAAAVGTLVHDIAATTPADEAALEAALADRLDELGPGTGWLARRRLESARSMLRRYAAYDRAAARDGWEVVGTELDARADVGRARITGRVDRLERNADGAVRVVDLKTGSHKPTAAEMARLPQLATYQVAVREGAFADLGATESAGAALVQLGKAAGVRVTVQEQPALRSENDAADAADAEDSDDADAPEGEGDWAGRLVAETAEGMAAAEFVARAGPWCRVCPLRTSCPVQPEGARR